MEMPGLGKFSMMVCSLSLGRIHPGNDTSYIGALQKQI